MNRSAECEAMRACAVAAVLALAQEYFSFTAPTGATGVPLDQAHVFAARRADRWERWPALPQEVHGLFGRLWQAIEEETDLAQCEAFSDAALEYAVEPTALFAVPDGTSTDDVRWVQVRHSQEPLALAARLINEAEAYREVMDTPLPSTAPGLWSFGPDGESTAEIPASEKHTPTTPIALTTAPFLAQADLPSSAVLEFVQEQAQAMPDRFGWKPGLIRGFFTKLTDAFGRDVATLTLPAGILSLLNAPTGVGKSVLMRDAALILARAGQGPVLVVVGTIREGLGSAEQIAADDALAEATAVALQHTARRDTGAPLQVTVWVAPSRQREQAALAYSQDRSDRFESLAAGCEMTGWQVDGPPVDPARPPCDQLQWAGPPDRNTPTGRHTCPRMAICGRFDHVRRAAQADVIITNHHNLLRGRVRTPVRIDGLRTVREMSVLEFLLRRCRIVIIDEIDSFQHKWCETGATTFLLASRGNSGHGGRLAEVDRQRGERNLSSLSNLPLTPALLKARELAETLLDNLLEKKLWLDSAQERNNRPGSGWYLPGMKDADLCRALLNLPDDTEIPDEVHQSYLALFPSDRTGRPPEGWDNLAALLTRAVDGRGKARKLSVIKFEMARILRGTTFRLPAHQIPEVVNDLLVRTWLGSLQAALHDLKWAVRSLAAQLPAAGDLLRAMSTLTDTAPLPFGALGSQLCGFKFDQGRTGGSLSYQAMSGDPHTGTVHLGDTVALATAGTRRAVLGLSATAFFPGAARQHIHTLPAYVMTDAAPGAVSAHAGHVSASPDTWQPISIGGLEEHLKPGEIRRLAERLWQEHLAAHLANLARNDPQRELALLAGNSYRHGRILAAGTAKACQHPEWVAVVVRDKNHPPTDIPLPPGIILLTIDELEDLPRLHPRVKVVCAPLSLVSRGLNILIPDTDLSALASVWVGVRPVTQLHSPSDFYASINAAGTAAATPGPDPAAMLKEQRRAARSRKNLLLRTDPRFSRMPRFLKAEVLAGILVELIQLAGRARRGGTPVELYLVDHAIFNTGVGCDFPSILRTYYANLPPEQQQMLQRIYGSTLTAWLDLAHSPDLLPNQVTLLPAPTQDDKDTLREYA
ncbi:hypothetical protein [Kitasatospora sp. NPDC056184]|uniref:hypothetical protein n=1 Tax=Kitasatospora sp. NPDC056184 TaxID=3345738 RepID=UPI0035DF86AF